MRGDLSKLRLVAERALDHGQAARDGSDVQSGLGRRSAELAPFLAFDESLLDQFGDAADQIEQKQALFRRIADLLGASPGIRPEDVFVNILESAKENWSVGNGVAQFA